MEESKLVKIELFHEKTIRKIERDGEWWFSIVDICAVLTESSDPGAYWRKFKQRLIEEGSEVVTFCHGLKLQASDSKKYEIVQITKGFRELTWMLKFFFNSFEC
jgi:prophage antirepressor-like protein